MIVPPGRWHWGLILFAAATLAVGVTLWSRNDLRSARWNLTPALQEGVGPQIVRGPYLQNVTTTSAVVRWRTGSALSPAITLRIKDESIDAGDGPVVGADEPTSAGTEHEVAIAGLRPGTNYEYSVGDEKTREAWGFRTAPATGAEQAPVRVWALGDFGTASPGAISVRDSYLRYTHGQLPDVWLTLGDNAYNTGTDLEFQAALFDTYRFILSRLPLWPTRGNHDQTQSSGVVPYFDIFTLPKDGEAGGVASGTESYYAFDHGPVHFVCLDSYATDRGAQGAMARWLVRDLKAAAAQWKVVFFHHPPYTRGTHDSDRERTMTEMRTNFVPLFEAGGVDLVLSGHSHSYERTGLLRGFYGPTSTFERKFKRASGAKDVVFYKKAGANAGIVYVVAGAAGELGRRFMGLDHPAMDISVALLGSVALTFAAGTAVVEYVDANAQVFDRFTIQKYP